MLWLRHAVRNGPRDPRQAAIAVQPFASDERLGCSVPSDLKVWVKSNRLPDLRNEYTVSKRCTLSGNSCFAEVHSQDPLIIAVSEG